MTTVYLVTTIAQDDVQSEHIVTQQTLYATFQHWTTSIAEAEWFTSRQAAIDFVVGSYSGNTPIDHFGIVELSYTLKSTDLTAKECEASLRQKALRKLTEDERRILGLADVSAL